jgi:hypothetical protein
MIRANLTRLKSGILKRRDHLGDIATDVIILKCTVTCPRYRDE